MKRALRLKEVLHALNVLGEEKDIYVDGFDGFCVTPPVMITEAGREHFADALNAKMYDPSFVCDDNEEVDAKAWELISALAGYCPDSKFALWFEGNDATEI